MGKAKNRNAQRIANGQKPKANISGKSHKPFIGNAVFTMEDDRIIRDILNTHPDTWTLAQIKDALPYSHTFKNITNYLQRLVPPEEIDRHSNMTDVPTQEQAKESPSETGHTGHRGYDTQTVREMLKTYFPQLGEQYTQWPELVMEKTGLKMTRSQIIRTARQNQFAYAPNDWTETENELLRSDGDTFLSDKHPETYVHDIFEYPRTHGQVLRQIENLRNREAMLHQVERDATCVEERRPMEKPAPKPKKPPVQRQAPTTVPKRRPDKQKEENAMPKTQTATQNTVTNNTTDIEAKNREDFIALSNILMNLTPDTEVHVNIKFANGLTVNFEKGAM